MKEYYHRKEDVSQFQSTKIKDAFEASRGTGNSVLHPGFLADTLDQAPKWFLGMMSPLTAAQKLSKGQMAVIYPLAEPELGDIPITLKPVLIYKNQHGKVSAENGFSINSIPAISYIYPISELSAPNHPR